MGALLSSRQGILEGRFDRRFTLVFELMEHANGVLRLRASPNTRKRGALTLNATPFR
jgi:hypothetical protein